MGKVRELLLFAYTIALVCPAFCHPCCNPPEDWLLPVPLRAQEEKDWCWAASGKMAMDFLGPDVSQCEQVNKRYEAYLRYDGLDCCLNPHSCEDKRGSPQFGEFGFAFKNTPSPLDWSAVKTEIYCKKRPFVYSYSKPDGPHMVVAIGYMETTAGGKFIVINDPEPQKKGDMRIVPYSQYTAEQHDTTYYNLRWQGGR